MTKKAKSYSAEEKSKIALEAIKGELTIAQISSKFGVHSTQIHHWKKQAIENMVSGFKLGAKSSAPPDQQALVKQLYEQIGQLAQERDWLKKNLQSLDLGARHNMIDRLAMDGKGRALDNIFIERFWRSLKQEKIYLIVLTTVKEAKNAITDYMNFYNTKRMHQSLDYNTPEFVYLQKNLLN